MTALSEVSIFIVILLIGAQLLKRPLLVSHSRRILQLVAAVMLIAAFLQFHRQFMALEQAEGFLRFLIPPYQPISYLFLTVFTKIIFSYLISLEIGLIITAAVKILPAQRRERIFETDEPFVMGLAIFLVGHPLWIILIILALGVLGLLHVIRPKTSSSRMSLYRFWLPLALLTLAVGPWLLEVPFLKILRLG